MKRWISVFALFVCPQVWAQSPKLPAKALVRVANPGALMMPGMAMPTTFPNTYASDVTMSFNPNAGSNGTIQANWQFTGTTQTSPMCGSSARHYGKVGVWLYNTAHNTRSWHYVDGASSPVAPCVQMNQTLSLWLDIGTDLCTFDLFMDGTCYLYEQDDEVYCTVAGDFAFLLKKFEMEGATTVDQVVGIYAPWLLTEYCAPSSSPADWRGPVGADSFGSGYWVSTGWMQRSQLISLSFYGVPWRLISKIGPSGQWAPGPKPICTNYDHGCDFVSQTCTAKAMPKEIHNEDIWKRRDA